MSASVTVDGRSTAHGASPPRLQDLLAQLAALTAQVQAAVDSGSVAGQDEPLALSDSRIGADGGALDEENPMCRIDGPFRDRGKWRVRIVDRETGKRKNHIYPTETAAKAAIPKLRREYARPVGVPLGDALDEYERYMKAKGNRPRSITTTLQRLRPLFSMTDTITGNLKPGDLSKMWEAYASKKAVDTNANTLNQARTFMRWCSGKGWLKNSNLLDGIEVLGKRRKGKPQLSEDESRRFLTVALQLGRTGDRGATAAATALLLGMRASEIADRIVRDLDGGGRILAITSAKTEAGVRRLRVPGVLQPLLQGLAAGKESGDRLLGPDANRHWVLRAVARICKAAKVPVVTTHGLRGTHATLAVDAGITGGAVAASLGHESFEGVTVRHYASADSVAGARADRVADALN